MHESWKTKLNDELQKPYALKLLEDLNIEYQNQIIYPKKKDVMRVLQRPFDETKVVILGQDPYHGPGQANGLAFAVNTSEKCPPSLRNIFKEIEIEFGEKPKNSTLEGWQEQGVFLLNSILTVRESQPGSHKDLGWQKITNTIISLINEKEIPVVFMLWGNYARSKKFLIDTSKHLVLESVHPSPLSASRGFFGCNHFIKANEFLVANNQEPINWINS